jgi:hypothetical protein
MDIRMNVLISFDPRLIDNAIRRETHESPSGYRNNGKNFDKNTNISLIWSKPHPTPILKQ